MLILLVCYNIYLKLFTIARGCNNLRKYTLELEVGPLMTSLKAASWKNER